METTHCVRSSTPQPALPVCESTLIHFCWLIASTVPGGLRTIITNKGVRQRVRHGNRKRRARITGIFVFVIEPSSRFVHGPFRLDSKARG